MYGGKAAESDRNLFAAIRCRARGKSSNPPPKKTTFDKQTMSDDRARPNAALLSALSYISSRPDHYYPSPEIQPKRASVALIIWIKPPPTFTVPNSSPPGTVILLVAQN